MFSKCLQVELLYGYMAGWMDGMVKGGIFWFGQSEILSVAISSCRAGKKSV